jgi:hypothetical protein
VGRLADADLISADQIEWKPFSAWPELVHALTASPLHTGGSERDDWLAERNNARARWADQRTGDDRRGGEPVTSDVANRREGETDRRMASPTLQRQQRSATRTSLSANLPVWALVAALIVVAALVAVLVAVFGAVNPVEVRLR